MFKQSLADQTLNENDRLTLTVKVTSKVDVTIRWIFNEKGIQFDDNVIQTQDDDNKVYTLTIKKITADFTGKFSVTAENKAGHAKSQCSIDVNSMYIKIGHTKM